MTSPQRHVVLVGTPCDAAARAHWDAVQSWADEHGWLTTRDIPAAGDVWGAVATEEVLDGMCSPTEAKVIYDVRAAGIPCVSVHRAPAMLASLFLTAAVQPA